MMFEFNELGLQAMIHIATEFFCFDMTLDT